MQRAVLFLMLSLVLSFNSGMPAADLPETAYDESELPWYERSPLILDLMEQVASADQTANSKTHATHNAPQPEVSNSILVDPRTITRTDPFRFTRTRGPLSLASTLRL